MKLAIIGVLAFVVALAAGTGIGVMTAPAPKAQPPAADSTAHAPVPPPPDVQPVVAGGTSVMIPAPPDSSRARGNAPDASAATSGPPVPSMAPGLPLAALAHARGDSGMAPPEPAAGPPSFKTVARILAGMKPTDSSQILAHLSDDQVEGILRASAVRQASTFMAQLPAARASLMTRRLMIAKPEVK